MAVIATKNIIVPPVDIDKNIVGTALELPYSAYIVR
jgi:hypothetical protein